MNIILFKISGFEGQASALVMLAVP